MAYVSVPKDLSKIKTKVVFNLTKRQLILFTVAFLIGLPLFVYLKNITDTSIASFAMILVMLPCFLIAMYEKNGQPLEVILKHWIQVKFLRQKIRVYKTNNLYSALEKQIHFEKEVKKIAKAK